MPYAGKSPTDPARRRQLTAIFLSIQRRKGTAAAKAEYRKQQGEGYAPVAKDDKMKVKQKPKRKVRAGKKGSYSDQRKAAELKRDPGDLVLTGKGTAAQERKRDPGEIYSRASAGSKSKKKARSNSKAKLGSGGRFAALEQKLQGQGYSKGSAGAIATAAGRKKYGAKRFADLSKRGR